MINNKKDLSDLYDSYDEIHQVEKDNRGNINLYDQPRGIFNSPETVTEYEQKSRAQQEKLISSPEIDELKKDFDETHEGAQRGLAPEETGGERLVRGAARTAARVAEIPINIISRIKELVEPKLDPSERNELYKHLDKLSLTDYPINIPQEKSLEKRFRESEKEITGGYLEPKTSGEESWDEFISDAASIIAIPGNAEATAVGRVLRGITAAGLGQGAKKYAKYSGLGSSAQDIAKNAVEFAATIYNPGGAIRRAGQLFQKANRILPETASGNTYPLRNAMIDLERRMTSGTLAPSENAIATEARLILDKINNGTMTFRSAIDSKRSINEKSTSFLYSTPDKAAQARARNYYRRIQRHLNEYIDMASNRFPEAILAQRQADEIFGAVHQSQRMGTFVRKLIKGHPSEAAIATIFGLAEHPGIKTAAIAAGYPVYRGYQVASRMIRSPQLRNYYFRALRQALAQNGPGLLKTLDGMRDKIDESPSLKKFLKEQAIREEYRGSKL